jgi:hypothetical protein
LLPAGTGAACGPPAAGGAGRLVPADGDRADGDWAAEDEAESDAGDEAESDAGDEAAEDETDGDEAGSLAEDGSSSRAPGALPGCAEIR